MPENEPKKVPIWKKLLRAFGFGFPDRLLVAHREGQDPEYIEDFEIRSPEEEERPVLKKKESIDDHQDLDNLDEKVEMKEDEDIDHSLVRDRETDKIYHIQGDVKSDLSPSSISDKYPISLMIVILPGFIIYTMILFWAFGLIGMGYLEVMISTFLLSTLIYQGWRIFQDSILSLDVSYQGQIEGLHLFTPMRPKYLDLKPTDPISLKDQTVSLILSYIRPILGENRALIEENNNMEERVLKAKKIGERKVLGQGGDESMINPWVLLLLGMIIGFISAYIILGGVAPAPSPEAEETAQMIGGILFL